MPSNRIHINPPKDTPIAWAPSPGPQTEAFLCEADELLYGGAAGGGKTAFLLVAALEDVHLDGYKAIVFRRTYPELESSIIDAARQLIPTIRGFEGAKENTSKHEWTFGKSKLLFRHMEDDAAALAHRSAEYQFCVARGTGVVMGDGLHVAIEDIRVGDLVLTLEGPRKVLATHRPGIKPLVSCSTQRGVSLVSATHRLLTPCGWVAPMDLQPTQCLQAPAMPEESPALCQGTGTPSWCLSSGQPQGVATALSFPAEVEPRENASSLAGAQSGSVGFGGVCQALPPPLAWSSLLVLHEPSPHQSEQGTLPAYPLRAPCRGRVGSLPQGSPVGCLCGPGSCGGRSRLCEEADRACTPSRVDGVEHISSCRSEGDPGHTLGCTQTLWDEWPHPYTKEVRRAHEVCRPAFVDMVQAGEGEVFDLTVESASHYILSSGIVASNCGFDELTTFTEKQYRTLLSRVRTSKGHRLRVRACSNPGGPGHEWVKRRWAPWLDEDYQGTGGRAVSGEVRYYLTHPETGEDIWVPRGTPGAQSRCFISAKLEDNPHLDAGYKARLNSQDPLTRKQLSEGDWSAKPSPKTFFNREWAPIVTELPKDLRCVRGWDRAATEEGSGRDPDYTVGVKLGHSESTGLWYVVDVVRLRAAPGGVQRKVYDTTINDGHACEQVIPCDPGSAGVFESQQWLTLLMGYVVNVGRETGDKVTRAKVWSAQFAPAPGSPHGRFRILKGAWNGEYLSELEDFPTPKVHDDQVDATSTAFRVLVEGGGGGSGITEEDLARFRTPGRSRNTVDRLLERKDSEEKRGEVRWSRRRT